MAVRLPLVRTEPSEHIYSVLQDHGPEDGGWGTAAIAAMPGLGGGPLVYGGTDENTIEKLKEVSATLARISGKPTLFVKFTKREDIQFTEGRGEPAREHEDHWSSH